MKRLYRSKNDVMIGGVCSGLANYLNVDATIVRLVFVLLLVFMTGGFWIYLAMWVIVPIEPSADTGSVDVAAKPASQPAKKATASTKPKPVGEPPAESTPDKPAKLE